MSINHNSLSQIFKTGTKYLSLLHLDSDDTREVFLFVKDACGKSPDPVSEIKSLLDGDGWREHLVGACALLVREDLAVSLKDVLWKAIDVGSWVSPQLAVTAWFRDPDFLTNAKHRIERRCQQKTTEVPIMSSLMKHVVAGARSHRDKAIKTFSALVYLLGLLPTSEFWLREQLQAQDAKEMLAADIDGGCRIAQNWITNLKAKSSIL